MIFYLETNSQCIYILPCFFRIIFSFKYVGKKERKKGTNELVCMIIFDVTKVPQAGKQFVSRPEPRNSEVSFYKT